MKITSLSLINPTEVLGVPTYTVGALVSDATPEFEVKEILFLETGVHKAYRGPCYIVSFVGTSPKRVLIPANLVQTVIYEVDSPIKKTKTSKNAKTASAESSDLANVEALPEDGGELSDE